MNLAVASGKGGTGKTTVAASLARVWPEPVVAVDLDVEEPNLHLFLRPEISGSEPALLQVPQLDESLCDACGACAELCQFKAISQLGKVLLVFSDMCHGCGGCLAICPRQALSVSARELGKVSWGTSGQTGFLMGRLRVGEAMSPPLMRAVHARSQIMLRQTPADLIVDAPPGVSCPALSAVMGSDAILLVTEPTPFGLYDLKLAHQAFAPLGKPLAVVINRAALGDLGVRDYCLEQSLPVLAEIPFQRQAAEAYSRGQILSEASPAWRELFLELATKVRDLVRPDAASLEAAHA